MSDTLRLKLSLRDIDESDGSCRLYVTAQPILELVASLMANYKSQAERCLELMREFGLMLNDPLGRPSPPGPDPYTAPVRVEMLDGQATAYVLCGWVQAWLAKWRDLAPITPQTVMVCGFHQMGSALSREIGTQVAAYRRAN